MSQLGAQHEVLTGKHLLMFRLFIGRAGHVARNQLLSPTCGLPAHITSSQQCLRFCHQSMGWEQNPTLTWAGPFSPSQPSSPRRCGRTAHARRSTRPHSCSLVTFPHFCWDLNDLNPSQKSCRFYSSLNMNTKWQVTQRHKHNLGVK